MEWTITPGINTGSPYLSSQDSDLEFFLWKSLKCRSPQLMMA